jgi:hypothetical protein
VPPCCYDRGLSEGAAFARPTVGATRRSGPDAARSPAIQDALPPVGSLSAGVNAIVDALSVYGISHIDTPCTPYRVWQAIAEAQNTP